MQKEKSLINRPINKNIKPKQNAATNKILGVTKQTWGLLKL